MIIPSKYGVTRKIRKAGKPDERQRTIYQKLNWANTLSIGT